MPSIEDLMFGVKPLFDYQHVWMIILNLGCIAYWFSEKTPDINIYIHIIQRLQPMQMSVIESSACNQFLGTYFSPDILHSPNLYLH